MNPEQLVACPECAQQPGEPCTDEDGNVLSYVHAKRVEAAAFVQGTLGRGETPTTDEFERAVLDSGLL